MKKLKFSQECDREVDAAGLADTLGEITGVDITARQIRTLRESGVLRFSSPSRFHVGKSLPAYIGYLERKRLQEIRDDLGNEYFKQIKNLVINEYIREQSSEIQKAQNPSEARKVLKSFLPQEAWSSLNIK